VYRIHPLLRSYLIADLGRQRPEAYRHRQAVAARWWLQEEEPVHALRHAERAGAPALVAQLVRESVWPCSWAAIWGRCDVRWRLWVLAGARRIRGSRSPPRHPS
jgi:hypothetical protein